MHLRVALYNYSFFLLLLCSTSISAQVFADESAYRHSLNHITVQEDSANKDTLTPLPFPLNGLKSQSSKTVQTIVNATTLTMGDNSIIRLDGILIPDQYTPNNQDSPIHTQALTLIEEHFAGKSVRAYYDRALREPPKDRSRHLLAQLVNDKDNIWAQKLLLETGLAVYWPSETTASIASYLRAYENVARTGKIGLWANEQYTPRTPENVKANSFQMQIVEGKPTRIATVRDMIYVNFGQNWREDFTVNIPQNLRKAFAKHGEKPISWQGKLLRIRGFVEDYNGPMIKIDSPEQIEIIE